MLFNSVEFAIFLPIVFVLYWFVTYNKIEVQNSLLLIASYFFYSWWDWRFLFLLVILSVANYLFAIRIEENRTNHKGKIWFITGLIVNLGVLGVFKYYNFFIDGFINMFSLVGYDLSGSTTKIIIPVGISFYVFLSLSYIIDIFKKTLTANRNIIEVLLSLSFFPIILSGPIQRPMTLITQISKKREFSYKQAVDGLKQILWGLFVKVVIADNLAEYVDDFFLNYNNYSGSTLLLGAIFYSVQIYADFSGYSDMAIGISKLFGINLMRNFAYPYLARDITEFWKRWHISLTTWFRDYVFLPLSFSVSWRIRGEKILLIKTDLFIYILASIITWLLTGFWHGAKYTFIIWGLIHGVFLIIYHLQKNQRKRLLKRLGVTNNHMYVVFVETFITITIVMLAWIFFRADNIDQAIRYLTGIFSSSLFSLPYFPGMRKAFIMIILVIGFVFIEWIGKEQQYAISILGLRWRKPLRYGLYYAIILAIILFSGKQQQFIYFQF
jgi:D-alanyl-lipoteichoic acid acyltransferase DltB (MBOAT superfamily)